MDISSAIAEAIEKEAGPLQELSGKIWSNPEMFYQEHVAHDALTEFLESRDFAVERHYKLDTAFRAVYKQGDGAPHVVVICEYDALPGIGHACGHNLIAEAGVAAGLALKAALQSSPGTSGTVTVLGTPAEEDGGGKIDLINGGAFDGVDVAMMVHPNEVNMMAPAVLSVDQATVTFTGRAAHAAAAPWEGVNALDAAVSAYTSLSMMRQQMKPDCRLHAVIKEGGVKPNIIPERSVMTIGARALSLAELAVLKEKTISIMKSAAQATGCQVEVVFEGTDERCLYANLHHNTELLAHFRRHWERLEPQHPHVAPDRVWASTDMGNVSQVVPSIHPAFNIGTRANIHTREFTAAAMTTEAHQATRCVAKAMACVGWDVLTDSAFLRRVEETFRRQVLDA